MSMPEPERPAPKRFAEPEIASAATVWRATLSGIPMPRTRGRRPLDPRLEAFGILLLAPALIGITVIILLALLGIFVVWLCVVGTLFVFTVIIDQIGRQWRRGRLFGSLDQRALGYPGR
jgi:hypothetical protein